MSHSTRQGGAMSGIEIRELAVAYGRKRVLQRVSLDVHAGSTTVLLGRNGTGKSTLLRACLGVIKPRSGSVRVAGLDPIKQRNRVLRRVGFVPDRPDVYGWMKPKDLFRLLKPHYRDWSDVPGTGTLRASRRAPAHQVSRDEQGPGHEDHVGGGARPRARCAVARRALRRHRCGSARRHPAWRDPCVDGQQRTVLLATHDLEVASRLADRVALLGDGQIEREGRLDEVVGAGSARDGLRELISAPLASERTAAKATVA